MNEHLSNRARELLKTQQGAYAVVMGYLKAERGKIAPSVFNKLVKQLNYPTLNTDELKDVAQEIQGDEGLKELYDKSFDRKIRLDEIPNYIEEEDKLLESDIFSQVTNFLIDNEDNNARLRELRKLQREGVYMKILMNNLKGYLKEELKGMPRAKYIQTPVPKPKKGDNYLLLCVSDWHIGALVYNEETGGYNFVKLTGIVQEIVQKVLQLVQSFNIKHIYVFHVGDMIEHINMRNVNQAFEAEFPATEQIAKGQRLIVDLLMQLSKHVHVTFGMVAGNHDRFQGNKNDKVHNDNVTYIILDTLFMLQEVFGQLPNVTLIDNRKNTYEFIQNIAGLNILVKHGDNEKKKDDVKIPKHIKNVPIDLYIMGHIHTNRVIQEDYERFHVYVGSPMGANNYSSELNLPTTTASQLIMIFTEGSKTPMFVPLMFDKGGKLN
ncbi:exonuclease [Bacillus phage Shbh1]|uniref:Putative DNA repair exonuclease n=1 Tax=Bacillus phage Shbh1 TaxID=1796992 RepID=A0A142F1J6_9CAUD|nr:exonuclease [Bacillus phage Shbh1]AMQ66653.1 putative DNA repair exonuclease [Bacillus phage Shbh1]